MAPQARPAKGSTSASLDSRSSSSSSLSSSLNEDQPHPPTDMTTTGSSRSLPLNLPFDISDIYPCCGESLEAADWEEYLSSAGFDCRNAFGALRNTVEERYRTIHDNYTRQQRLKYLKYVYTDQLVNQARNKHQEICKTCKDSDQISPQCALKDDAKQVKFGHNEINAHTNFYRPIPPSRDALYIDFRRMRLRPDMEEVGVVTNLLDMYPYMSYSPGEYLLRLTKEGVVCSDGIVPFKPEEDLERLDQLCPGILKMAVAILGFKPGTAEFVPSTMRALLEAPELSYGQWAKLVEALDFKFKDSPLPECIRFSVAGAHTMLGEAACIIERLMQNEWKLVAEKPKKGLQMEAMEKLLPKMTGLTMDELKERHLAELCNEAMDCLNNGEEEKVLAYTDGSWPKKTFKDIHHFYRVNTGFPPPAPFDQERLEGFRVAALRILRDDEFAKGILSHISQYLIDHGKLRKDDPIDAALTVVEGLSPAPSQPEASSRPAASLRPAAPKKRGRPLKKEGDPKGPYTKKARAAEQSPKPRTPPLSSSPAPPK
ncbi:uncharacterized protein PG998_013269 [Apiospora kogelbergensis]|uniref:uncharacterized protein n=1 Tax=Apiospora kogelbergensis TaxID=1337665 RepID=UPI0031304666